MKHKVLFWRGINPPTLEQHSLWRHPVVERTAKAEPLHQKEPTAAVLWTTPPPLYHSPVYLLKCYHMQAYVFIMEVRDKWVIELGGREFVVDVKYFESPAPRNYTKCCDVVVSILVMYSGNPRFVSRQRYRVIWLKCFHSPLTNTRIYYLQLFIVFCKWDVSSHSWVFWNVESCSIVEIDRRFFTLIIDAVRANFCDTHYRRRPYSSPFCSLAFGAIQPVQLTHCYQINNHTRLLVGLSWAEEQSWWNWSFCVLFPFLLTCIVYSNVSGVFLSH